MGLTLRKNRRLRAAMLAAWLIASGCQRLPYIDQSKPVPHDNMAHAAMEDSEVQRAQLLSNATPVPLPRLSKPRTTNDPEAAEVWPMTLQQAIRIGLDNSEVVRVIAFGAQGIPIGGFEPTPLNYRSERGRRQLARRGNASDGLRPGDPRNPDRRGALKFRHGVHDQHPLGRQRSAVQQRRARRLAEPDGNQVSRSSR